MIAVPHVIGMIVLFHGPAEIHRRQQGKNVSLQQSHEQFQEVHEDGEDHAYRPQGQALKNEDQGEQAQDNNVAGGNVGKQPDHQ